MLSTPTLDLSIILHQLPNIRVICTFSHTVLYMEPSQYLHDNCRYMQIQLMASAKFHWPLKSITHIRSISSKVWMVLLDWPSIWGWKTVLKSSLVSIALCNSCQKTEVKVAPLSDIILTGTQWRQTIRLTYSLTNLPVEYVFLMGKKWVVFVNLPTIT